MARGPQGKQEGEEGTFQAQHRGAGGRGQECVRRRHEDPWAGRAVVRGAGAADGDRGRQAGDTFRWMVRFTPPGTGLNRRWATSI